MKRSIIHTSAILFVLLAATSCRDKSIVQRKTQELQEQNETLIAQLEEGNKQQQALEKSIAQLHKQIKQVEQAADQQERTLLTQLEEEQKQRQTIEKSIAELREQMKQAEQVRQSTETPRDKQWNALIDQILVKLERVKDEEQNFSSASLESELYSEETRLKGIAREQESLARSLVYELKAKNFPKTEALEGLVKEFISDYIYYVSYRRVSWESIKTLGETSDNVKEQERKFQTDYYDKLRSIKALKHTAVVSF
jgi:chromosome segregation ATPase